MKPPPQVGAASIAAILECVEQAQDVPQQQSLGRVSPFFVAEASEFGEMVCEVAKLPTEDLREKSARKACEIM